MKFATPAKMVEWGGERERETQIKQERKRMKGSKDNNEWFYTIEDEKKRERSTH